MTIMKKNFLFSMLFMMGFIMTGCSLTSCGGDDDSGSNQATGQTDKSGNLDENGGEGAGDAPVAPVTAGVLTVNGRQYPMPYLYWFCNDYNESDGTYHYKLEFYAYDKANNSGGYMGLDYHTFYIGFTAVGNSLEVPTVELGGEGGKSYSMDINYTHFSGISLPLSITKKGDIYDVKMAEGRFAPYSREYTDTVAFRYVGPIKSKAPVGL